MLHTCCNHLILVVMLTETFANQCNHNNWHLILNSSYIFNFWLMIHLMSYCLGYQNFSSLLCNNYGYVTIVLQAEHSSTLFLFYDHQTLYTCAYGSPAVNKVNNSRNITIVSIPDDQQSCYYHVRYQYCSTLSIIFLSTLP